VVDELKHRVASLERENFALRMSTSGMPWVSRLDLSKTDVASLDRQPGRSRWAEERT
jgi:hypothetical protein